ncbi:MAG: hypothetical protein RDV41_13765, partial [Planctomycetota bacterium]|nr:hypothetical protein [Planctomycetota bacterium]
KAGGVGLGGAPGPAAVKPSPNTKPAEADAVEPGAMLCLVYAVGGGLVAWLVVLTLHPAIMSATGIPQAAIWLVTFLAAEYATRRIDLSRSHLVRFGIAAGLVGLLCHSMMDFNFYVDGIAFTAWLLAAVLFAAVCIDETRGPLRLPLSIPASALVVIVPLAGFLLLTTLAVPAFLEAEADLDWARAAVRNREVKPEEILERLENSARLYSGNAEVWQLRAVVLHGLEQDSVGRTAAVKLLRELGPEKAWRILDEKLGACAESLERAMQLDPSASKLRFLLGKCEAEHAKTWQYHANTAAVDQKSGFEAMARRCEQRALEELRVANELYPTCPENRYCYGVQLERAGRKDEALREYREALRLHDLQRLDRLRLEEKTARELRRKTK